MKPKWESEAAMLTAFMAWAKTMDFKCAPESCGHDLILTAGAETSDKMYRAHYVRAPFEAGDILAVEGKLQANVTVLRQAMPPFRRRAYKSEEAAAADFYCIVIPRYDSDFLDVCDSLDICAIEFVPPGGHGLRRGPNFPRFNIREEHRCIMENRITPTALDVELTPGLPSPRALSPWKLAAVRWCLEAPAEFGTRDVPGLLNIRTFIDRGWAAMLRREGRRAVYALTDHPQRPDRKYPEIAAAIVKDPGLS